MSADTEQKSRPEAANATSERGAQDGVNEKPAVETGIGVIRRFQKNLPSRPGVYRMINADGDVLYVGKAKHLKNRVQSYTRMAGHTNRIAAMIALTASMEFVTTNSEAEALLLEANLIKRYKPRYNVLLRDDKSFPYILIADHDEAALLTKHRGARSGKGSYYGPFASAGSVNRTMDVLQKAFLLRSCSDSVYNNRTRPCLLYQIKRCSAPCTGEIKADEYNKLVRAAKNFLSGKSKTVHAEMLAAMDAAAEAMEYEQAAIYRDRIAAMGHVTAQQGINPMHLVEADVFALGEDSGQIAIQVFFFRGGQNWGNRCYFPRLAAGVSVNDVLAAFVAQFYDNKPVAKEILLSHDFDDRGLLQTALTNKAERKIDVQVPQRGEKKRLVEHAFRNACDALARKLADSRSQSKLLAGVGKVFGLEAAPRRIEVYDNSHIQGTEAVGGMIVAGPEGFIKNQYRKFNIKSSDIEPGDDVAMMGEVLKRRFSRLKREHGVADNQSHFGTDAATDGDENAYDYKQNWPDLVLVDGGMGQLSAAQAVFDELGINQVMIAGVAKGPERDAGREHFYLMGKPSFMLDSRDPVLYYIQRLRDEAHRFAIGSHRARRAQKISRNPLDEIAGIGAGRKKALLRAFGSARDVSRASIADLAAVTGVSHALAKKIYAYFNEADDE